MQKLNHNENLMYQKRKRSVEPKLKPLFANLKRLRIGDYLYTKEFELFAIENNIDEVWSECKSEVNNQKKVISIGYHNTEDEEDCRQTVEKTVQRTLKLPKTAEG